MPVGRLEEADFETAWKGSQGSYGGPGGQPFRPILTDFNAVMKAYKWQLAQNELDESVRHSRNYVVAARGLGLRNSRRNSWAPIPVRWAS